MRKFQKNKIAKIIKTIEEKERLTDKKCLEIKDINLSLKDNIDEYLESLSCLPNMS